MTLLSYPSIKTKGHLSSKGFIYDHQITIYYTTLNYYVNLLLPSLCVGVLLVTDSHLRLKYVIRTLFILYLVNRRMVTLNLFVYFRYDQYVHNRVRV